MADLAAPSAPTQYSRALITLHWLMAALIIALIVIIEAREFVPKENPLRAELKGLHYSLGLAVLGLLLARIGARAASSTPLISPKPPAWQTGISHLIHLALYVIMIAMPILGWLSLSGMGKDISFFGIALPPLMAENRETGHFLEEIHATIGEAAIWIIGLHAAAALFHHFVVKDNTLSRMVPAR